MTHLGIWLKKRNAEEEFQKQHIENAIFFDSDKNSNKKKELPHGHFLPTIENHEKAISEMGILNTDQIVIYCHSDLISSCRAWFQFIYFGHNPKLVSVLNGGMKKWKLESKKVTNKQTKIQPSKYNAKENKNMIKIKLEIEQNIKKKQNIISEEEFNKEIKELRVKIKTFRAEKDEMVKYINKLQKQELTILYEKINPIIQNYMEANSIEIILDVKNIIIGKASSNITEDIIKDINKKFN